MTILYFVAYSFCYMVSLLPFWVLYRISDLFYVLLYHIIKYKRKVVRNNLRISFPQKGENEILAIEKKFYAFLCDQFVETIKLCSITEKGIGNGCHCWPLKYKNITQKWSMAISIIR